MDEDEEDRVLLNALGVTSAYQEDIERDIIEKAREDAVDSDKVAGGNEEELDAVKSNGNLSNSHENLANKLRAVNLEIDAVRSAVEQLENFKRGKDQFPEDDDKTEQDNTEGDTIVLQSSSSTLQHALAADRLESLIKTRAQIEKEISGSSKNNQDNGRLIRNLIKEVPKPKRELKDVDKTSRNKNKRLKKVSVDEGDDFEAMLNATSAGFVETERDELVRKGIFTPFHKLKGYERRIQEPGSSSRHVASEDAMTSNDLASSSIARAVQLMSEASKARPTTKMLDPELVPKLDSPSFPFQRLQKPLKIPQSLKTESNQAKVITRKKRRPQPGKKWKKLASREEEDGIPKLLGCLNCSYYSAQISWKSTI